LRGAVLAGQRDQPRNPTSDSLFRHARILSRLQRFEAAASTEICLVEGFMKGLAIAGVLVLILGIISFFVPMPHEQHHGVSVGDAHVGVTTEHDQKVPAALSAVLVVVGAGLVIAGRKA
jgi:hypothetical protein